MDFKKKIDLRVAIAKIAFILTVATFVTIIFSVKDQEFYIVNWLKENFIRKEDKILILGRVETALCTIGSLLEVLFFFNLYKSGNMPKYGMQYFITSAVCLAYWLVYIISGIIIQKVANDDEE